MSNLTIGPGASKTACRPLGMKFFTGCNQLSALPWPRISQSWVRAE
jgi:hypothetical protein